MYWKIIPFGYDEHDIFRVVVEFHALGHVGYSKLRTSMGVAMLEAQKNWQEDDCYLLAKKEIERIQKKG